MTHRPQATDRPGLLRESPQFSTGLKILLGLAIWLLLAFLQAGRLYYGLGWADTQVVSWQQTLIWALGDWFLWGLASLVIYRIASRVRFDQAKWLRAVAIHLPFAIAIILIRITLYSNYVWWSGWCTITQLPVESLYDIRSEVLQVRLASDTIIYMLIVFICYSFLFYRRYRTEQLRNAETHARLAEAELQVLKGHLQPHFLFNTLHTIAALVDLEPGKAGLMIARLSDLLRASLETANEQTTTLREEMEFLDRYLDIQKIRYADRLTVIVDIPTSLLDASVPTMILQPLVENAIRHGLATTADGGTITIRGSVRGQKLQLQVLDDGAGMPPDQNAQATAGKGLAITRERLRTLYGEHQDLRIEPGSAGGATVTVTIPLEGDAAEVRPPDHE